MPRKSKTDRVLALRTTGPNGESHNGFRWPLEVGARVEAPDWNARPECGGGLHGLVWGEGDGYLLNWSGDARWLVVDVEGGRYVDIGGKGKFRACTVLHVGDRKSATDYIIAEGARGAVVGCTLTGGDRSILTGGYRSILTGGDCSTLTGGDCSILMFKWFDGARQRIAIGYVGEDEIEPNKPYRCEFGKIVLA